MFDLNYSPQKIREMSVAQLQDAIETQEFLILWESNQDEVNAMYRQSNKGDVNAYSNFCLAHGPAGYRRLREEWDARGCQYIDPLDQKWEPVKFTASDFLRLNQISNPKSNMPIDDFES